MRLVLEMSKKESSKASKTKTQQKSRYQEPSEFNDMAMDTKGFQEFLKITELEEQKRQEKGNQREKNEEDMLQHALRQSKMGNTLGEEDEYDPEFRAAMELSKQQSLLEKEKKQVTESINDRDL